MEWNGLKYNQQKIPAEILSEIAYCKKTYRKDSNKRWALILCLPLLGGAFRRGRLFESLRYVFSQICNLRENQQMK